MNIIFGKENADQLAVKYTVLELDTIRFANGSIATAYCIVEDMKLDEIPMIESMRNMHQDLMIKYQSRNWTTCLEIIKHLHGFWNGELDSYYETLQHRLKELIEQTPGPDWSPTIQK